MKISKLVVWLFLWTIVPSANALVFVAQPQETAEVGAKIYQPIVDLLSKATGQPWTYQHPNSQLNYVDIIVEDRAALYFGDSQFVGYQLKAGGQQVLAQLPQQQWVLAALATPTAKLLGSRALATFSCIEAATCALPPPNLGMLLFSNLQVFAENPLRQPMLVPVGGVADVVDGVLDGRCTCGVTRKALLKSLPEATQKQLSVRALQSTLGAAFTVSKRVSPELAEQIQTALLSPEGQKATQALRDTLYGGAPLGQPADTAAYQSFASLLVNGYLIPMNRMPTAGDKTKEASTEVATSSETTATQGASQSTGSSGKVHIIVSSWGGAYSASQWKAYYDPYMKLHPDVKITEDELGIDALPTLRKAVESGQPIPWDLMDMTAANAIAACNEGLVMKVPHDKWLAPAPDGTPASRDFGAMIVAPCLIPEIVYSTTFGYRNDLLARDPDSIDDVFNLAEFPGRRSLEKQPINNFEWALLADGVPPDEIYDLLETPAGVGRALAKLDTIKDQVVWWSKGETPVKLLEEGAVVIASAYNGRLFPSIVGRKQPISMLWDWQIFDLDGWVIPKGTDQLEAVKKFLYFATDTQRLADQAKYISYGPARASSAPLVGKSAEYGVEMAPYMPTNPANSKHILIYNYGWWSEHLEAMTARFNQWVNK